MAINQLPELLQDLKQLQADLGFNGPSKASEEIVKDLQGLSPAWTGKFRNSWFIRASDGRIVGGGGQPGNAAPLIGPRLSGTTIGKTTFGTTFVVGNSAPYADQATDLEPFKPTKPLRKGEERTASTINAIKFGVRPEGARRGDVSGEGSNSSSAPLDWFNHYSGTKLDKAVERAYSGRFRGFRR
jgi:hypothetical protein